MTFARFAPKSTNSAAETSIAWLNMLAEWEKNSANDKRTQVSRANQQLLSMPLGQADYPMRCVGFITMLIRGVQWAATGKVTSRVPEDIPTAEKTSSRK
jgi:hypothetical protein